MSWNQKQEIINIEKEQENLLVSNDSSIYNQGDNTLSINFIFVVIYCDNISDLSNIIKIPWFKMFE